MKPKRFFFTPEGGLGNRIRSIASAYAFSKEFGYEPTIYWFADKILINVHFCELFEPIDFIHEGNNVSAFLYDRSRKKTLWIPGIFQKLSFDRVIYSAEADEFYRNEKKYSELSSYHRLYMTSYRDFFPYDNTIHARLFVPVPKIRKLIDEGAYITINSDNMMFDYTNIINEYNQLKMLGITDAQLRQFTINAINAAFIDENTKQELMKRVD